MRPDQDQRRDRLWDTVRLGLVCAILGPPLALLYFGAIRHLQRHPLYS